MSVALRVMLLTEDSGDDAPRVLERVVERLLRMVSPGCDPRAVLVLPQQPHAQRAMQFLTFRARKAHRARVDLAREIVDRLTDEGPPTFVMVHVDGDRAWTERARPPVHVAEFEDHVIPGVEEGLRALGVDGRRDHIRFVVPHYSMEAWLYQRVDRLRELYAAHHRDLELIASWEADPGALDEVIMPKEILSIGDKHNIDLAERLPGRKLLDIGKSFAATVEDLRGCRALMVALEQTSFSPRP